jgi:hypothetical protein
MCARLQRRRDRLEIELPPLRHPGERIGLRSTALGIERLIPLRTKHRQSVAIRPPMRPHSKSSHPDSLANTSNRFARRLLRSWERPSRVPSDHPGAGRAVSRSDAGRRGSGRLDDLAGRQDSKARDPVASDGQFAVLVAHPDAFYDRFPEGVGQILDPHPRHSSRARRTAPSDARAVNLAHHG